MSHIVICRLTDALINKSSGKTHEDIMAALKSIALQWSQDPDEVSTEMISRSNGAEIQFYGEYHYSKLKITARIDMQESYLMMAHQVYIQNAPQIVQQKAIEKGAKFTDFVSDLYEGRTLKEIYCDGAIYRDGKQVKKEPVKFLQDMIFYFTEDHEFINADLPFLLVDMCPITMNLYEEGKADFMEAFNRRISKDERDFDGSWEVGYFRRGDYEFGINIDRDEQSAYSIKTVIAVKSNWYMGFNKLTLMKIPESLKIVASIRKRIGEIIDQPFIDKDSMVSYMEPDEDQRQKSEITFHIHNFRSKTILIDSA